MSEVHQALTKVPEDLLRELAPIFDIPLQITIEVGRLRLRVRDLAKLGPGSIIELKKPAGDPFDICINGVPAARGDVIVVDQSSGVRIVEILRSGGLLP
jgi:flagellar motor switch protein FliN/FliY